jgi:hypothetical protein
VTEAAEDLTTVPVAEAARRAAMDALVTEEADDIRAIEDGWKEAAAEAALDQM